MLKKVPYALTLAVIILSVSVLTGAAFAGPYQNAQAGGKAIAAIPQGANCETYLDNNLYSCNVVSSFGGGIPFHDCMQFISPGVVSSEFDLHVVTLGGDNLGCTCKAEGTPTGPIFDATLAFDCVAAAGNATSSAGFTFEGQAWSVMNLLDIFTFSGNKIYKGFTAHSNGDSFTFECTVDPTCTP